MGYTSKIRDKFPVLTTYIYIYIYIYKIYIYKYIYLYIFTDIHLYLYIYISVLDASQDLLFWKMQFSLSLRVILFSFEFIKVSIIGTFWCLLEIFQRFPCILTKLLILRDKFYRHIQKYAFLSVLQKKSSRSIRQRLISKCLGNLVVKLITM